MATLDMTDGVYRRIYSGFLANDRVNAVSWMAEAWFWRLVVSADDYGNYPASWRHLAVAASPVREVTAKQAQDLTMELVRVGLVMLYESGGASYLHIIGFTRRQPANRNGRRIQRFPMNPDVPKVRSGESGGIQNSPGESNAVQGNPGESGGIQSDPRESSPSDSDSDSDSETNTESESKPPQPPKGGGGDEIKQTSPTTGKPARNGRTRKTAAAATLAQVAYVFEGRGFSGVEFVNALEAFYGHRNESGHPMTLRAASAMVTQFANFTEREATECLVQSVANGWRGVFPEKVRRTGTAAINAANRGGGSSIDAVIAEAQRLRDLEERRTA